MINYVIAWKSLRTNETFRGSALPCKPNVESLNLKYAGLIHHWIEEIQEEKNPMVTKKARKSKEVYYGLSVFEIESDRQGFPEEWVICSESQAYKIAQGKVLDDLWAFNADFIIDFLKVKKPEICNKETAQVLCEAIVQFQEKMCESAQPIIKALIEPHLDKFIESAIEADGIGHFVSSYDSEMHRTRDIEGLNPGHGPVCFRVN